MKFLMVFPCCLLTLVLFTACLANVSVVTAVDSRPPWIDSPVLYNGDVCGIGISKIHINGELGQRQLAVDRAIADIARQKRVTVKSVYASEQSVNSSGVHSVNFSTHDVQTVDGVSFSVQVKEYWKDPKTGDIYVCVVEVR
jgi:peptide deformylase